MKVLSRLKKVEPGRILGGALGLLLVLTLVFALAPPAMAVPQLAHRFDGSVTINVVPAAEGVEVSATIAGVDEVFTATTDAEGKYHLLYVRGDDPETPEIEGGNNGDEIDFSVDDVYVISYTFESGASTTLNLTVSLEELEYGDAPDPTYPSLLASDGARHFLTHSAFLGLQSTGDGKDFELDANVPDLDLLDDGLVTTTITAGNPAETVSFEVFDNMAPSYDLRVNILIDLNADGDWIDAGEHVVVNQQITTTATGTEEQVLDSTPFSTVGATPGSTWLRMTLTRHEIQNPPWDGTMADAGLGWDKFECGETEDWAITIEPIGALSASEGPNTPSDHGWYWDPTAEPYNEMLQIALTADATEDITLNSVTVEASGTGNDATGIASVDLVVDLNSNGVVDDPSELPAIATGTYAADDGALTLTIPGGYTVAQGTTKYFIIDYQMNSSPSVGDTFIATITAVAAVGASTGLAISVSGLPIASATKTTVAVPQYTLTVASGDNGSVTTPGEGAFGPYDLGDEVNLVADPDTGYQFVNWTGDTGNIADVSAASTTITMNGDYSITANFALITYDLTVASTADGSVTDPGEGTFTRDCGTVVNLVAVADDCYEFVNWTGDTGNIADVNAASTTITMNGNYSITANFALITYDLTVASTAGGSVTGPGEGTFTRDCGTVVNLVADPDTGYQFVNWTGDTGNIADVSAASTTITMNGDYSITANFTEGVSYDLTVASTAGGSVTDPGEGTFAYNEGEEVNLVAVADACYEFVNWTGDTGNIANVNAASTTITMNGNYSITANFALITYDLTVASTAGGSVTDPGEGTFTRDCGTVVNLVAVADDGYEFVNWTGDTGNIANVNAASTTITMNGDYSITANFTLTGVTYDLTVASTAGGSVTGPGEGTFSYDAGAVVNLVAVADAGYEFDNWTGDTGDIADANAASTTITMNGDYSVTANFAVSLGDLVDETESGETLDLGAGTYTGGTIDKPMTISGTEGTVIHGGITIGELTGSEVTIENLTITDYTDFGIKIVKVKAVDTFIIRNNTIQGVAGSEEGIQVDEVKAGGSLTIEQNSITGNETGIKLEAAVAEATIKFNDINGNTTGLDLAAGGSASAGMNWWGDNSGPKQATTNPRGEGNEVSGNADYQPWLTEQFATAQADNIAYFGHAWVRLSAGWNIMSTPIALDPACDTWGEYVALGDPDLPIHATSPTYSFNAQTGAFVALSDDDQLDVCDAIYVRMTEAGIAPILYSPSTSVPSKDLYAGWNLVSLAYVDGTMAANEALSTVYTVTGNLSGYSLVVSPPVNQDFWTYIRDGTNPPDMKKTEGYWVFMTNPGTLAGFAFTPMSLPQ